MKEHKKMYKAGKKWIVATLALATLQVGIIAINDNHVTTVHADSSNNDGWQTSTNGQVVLWVNPDRSPSIGYSDDNNGGIGWGHYDNGSMTDSFAVSSVESTVSNYASVISSAYDKTSAKMSAMVSTANVFSANINYLSSVASSKGLPSNYVPNELGIQDYILYGHASGTTSFAVDDITSYAARTSTFTSNAKSNVDAYYKTSLGTPDRLNAIASLSEILYSEGFMASAASKTTSEISDNFATYYYEYFNGDSMAINDAYINITGSNNPDGASNPVNINNNNAGNGNNTSNNTGNGNNTSNNTSNNNGNSNNTSNNNAVSSNAINSNNYSNNNNNGYSYYSGSSSTSSSASSASSGSSATSANSSSSVSNSNSTSSSSANSSASATTHSSAKSSDNTSTGNGNKTVSSNNKLSKELSKAKKRVLKMKKSVSKNKHRLAKAKSHKAKASAKRHLIKAEKAYNKDAKIYNKLLKEYKKTISGLEYR